MNHPVQADINHFLKHLVQALKPIAKAEDIDLSFVPHPKPVVAVFQAASLAGDITHIVCKLIEFTPEQGKIIVSTQIINDQTGKVTITNSGINTFRVKEITHPCKLSVNAIAKSSHATQYEIEVDLNKELPEPTTTEKINEPNFTKEHYQDVKTRLRAHFTTSDNLLEKMLEQNPREAQFLKKVHSVVLANLNNSQFDTSQLSEILNMSRTQLFRKLKPIVMQSPGNYIRTIKLDKAKELFKTTNLRIGEVAYKTGFETASHFTKAFTKQYGVTPSLFCQKKEKATNK
jgi:AraC-like DNA-binding protein